jgi:hypothetical protein
MITFGNIDPSDMGIIYDVNDGSKVPQINPSVWEFNAIDKDYRLLAPNEIILPGDEVMSDEGGWRHVTNFLFEPVAEALACEDYNYALYQRRKKSIKDVFPIPFTGMRFVEPDEICPQSIMVLVVSKRTDPGYWSIHHSDLAAYPTGIPYKDLMLSGNGIYLGAAVFDPEIPDNWELMQPNEVPAPKDMVFAGDPHDKFNAKWIEIGRMTSDLGYPVVSYEIGTRLGLTFIKPSGAERKTHLSVEKTIPDNVIAVMKHSPKSQVVRGMVRSIFNVVLTPEIQEKGLESIIEFIKQNRPKDARLDLVDLSSRFGSVPLPCVPRGNFNPRHPLATNLKSKIYRVKFTGNVRETWKQWQKRTNEVEGEIDIPGEIVAGGDKSIAAFIISRVDADELSVTDEGELKEFDTERDENYLDSCSTSNLDEVMAQYEKDLKESKQKKRKADKPKPVEQEA